MKIKKFSQIVRVLISSEFLQGIWIEQSKYPRALECLDFSIQIPWSSKVTKTLENPNNNFIK